MHATPNLATLLITLGFPPAIGGIQSLLWRRATLGGERMIVIAPSPAMKGIDRVGNVLRWHTPLDHIPGLKRLSQLIAPLALAASLCQRKQVGFVEAGQVLPFGVTALLLKRRFGLPYAIWAYGDDLLKPLASPILRPWLRLCLAQAQIVYACSHWTAGIAVQAGAPPDRVEVVYPWPAPNFFQPTPKFQAAHLAEGSRFSPPRIRLLTVARIEPRKGIAVVLEALPAVKAAIPAIEYEIVGEGSQLPDLQQQVTRLRLDGVVHFAGKITDQDLPQRYAAADLFVMTPTPDPSKGENEGFGLVYGEAAACHKPSIAVRCGGVPEAVRHGETGLLANYPHPQEVADLIITLARDPALRQRMGAAAYDLACQRADAATRRFGACTG